MALQPILHSPSARDTGIPAGAPNFPICGSPERLHPCGHLLSGEPPGMAALLRGLSGPQAGMPVPLALGTAASGGDDDFPYCPICGGFHSENFDCRPPWLAEHLDSRDPGIPTC